MKVVFIHHSCFVVEIEDKVLVFDYFGGDKVKEYRFQGQLPEYPKDTKLYMFASHSHHDHYDLDILRWTQKYPNIQYVFSKEIRVSPNFLKKHAIDPKVRERIHFVAPDKNYEVDDMNIFTLRSTDIGVAYYVDIHGTGIFHSGDLNDWRWEGAGELVNGKIQRSFQHEIRKLAELPITCAFVPMDPRLQMHQFRGIDYVLKQTAAKYVFPMHMWQDYSGIREYKKRVSNLGMAQRVMEISHENQVFVFDENEQ